MIKIRDAPSLIDAWSYPVVEAGGYIGRQMWSSVISAVLVYLPVAFISVFTIWPATQFYMLVYMFVPLVSAALLEFISYGIRRFFNMMSTRGAYIRNRTWFGFYDFLGLFVHLVT